MLWGWWKGVPWGVASCRCEGCLRLGARPHRLPIFGAGDRGRGLLPTCCGRVCAGVGTGHCPFGARARRGIARRAGGGRSPRGADLSPLPTFPGRRWCWRGDPGLHRSHSVRSCVPWGRREGVSWGLARAAARGVWGQELSLSRPPVLWAGSQVPSPMCDGRGCAGVGARHCPLACVPPGGLRAAWVA